MAIDPSKALGAQLPPAEATWTQDQIILYALGAGIGYEQDPTDKQVLQYTYENGLKALPTYAVIPVFGTLMSLMTVPGIQINPMMILHGEQYAEILRAPMPVNATVINEAKLIGIYDKGFDKEKNRGKGATIEVEVLTREKSSGEPLFRNIFTTFVRGEGGFAREGDPVAPPPGNDAPSRAPDKVLEYKTMGHQALLYRLSGDKNPLHADPMFAKMGGFEKPILHGLCTFANVGRAVIDGFAGGDPTKFKSIKVRFSSPVYPGETIVVSMWQESPTDIIVKASVKERNIDVITNAKVTLFA
jgi:acyl dehydratase